MSSRSNLALGLVCLALAGLAIFVWVPLDTDTGLVEKVRRRVTIGDALAPTLALAIIALGGAFLVVSERNAEGHKSLTLGNLGYVAVLLCLLVGVFGVMRWAGPASLALLGHDEPYRLLRDTAPWKWIGFFLGGSGLIATLISAVERKLTLKALVIGGAATIALIALFDLPFDDLLLPPNGDV